MLVQPQPHVLKIEGMLAAGAAERLVGSPWRLPWVRDLLHNCQSILGDCMALVHLKEPFP